MDQGKRMPEEFEINPKGREKEPGENGEMADTEKRGKVRWAIKHRRGKKEIKGHK